MNLENFLCPLLLKNLIIKLAFFLFLTPLNSFGEINFEPDPIRSFSTISAVYSMSSADFNGDGIIDIAATNYFEDGSLVTIHLNNSDASGLFLWEPFIINLPCNMSDIKSADFTLDGKPDLIIAAWDSLVILENKSTITSLDFTAHKILTGKSYSLPFLVSDFNNDGKIDLVVSSVSDSIHVFENISTNLKMKFLKAVSLYVPDFSSTFSYLTTGDFDSNGMTDIAVATSWRIFVLSNTSSAAQISFAEPIRVNPFVATGPFAAGDLDDDGKVDLICSDGGEIVFLRNKSTQSTLNFVTAGAIDTDGSPIRQITIAYLDNDDKPEFIIHKATAWFAPAGTYDYVEIYENNSTSDRFIFEGKRYGVAWDPSFIIAADLDNDDVIDIAASSYQGCSISLLHNLGNESLLKFDSSLKLPVEYLPWTIHASDLNNDAKQDLISANWGSRTLSIFKNNSVLGKLEFDQPLTINMGYHHPEYETVYTGCCDFSIADFNGDGLNDLAVAHMDPTYISLFQNFSSFERLSFTLPDTILLKSRSDQIFSADFNDDGKMDLIVSDGVLINSSSIDKIKFEKPISIGGSTILPRAIADFDGDSKVDIFTSPYFYLNESSINELKFNSVQNNLVWMHVKYAKADDCNGDGKPDLLLTDTDGHVRVYLNFSSPGNLVFSESKEYRPLREARAIASKDLTGDGKSEIIVNNQDNNVAILENSCSNEEIDFQPAFPGYIVVGNSQSLAIEDLDGDTSPEIISTRSSSNEIVIVRTKSYTPPTAVDNFSKPVLPTDYVLDQNYPNPFNPITIIKYQLPEATDVTLKVYSALGQLIRTLISERQRADYYSIKWDGTDDRGSIAASGVYFYRIEAGNFVQVRKALFLK